MKKPLIYFSVFLNLLLLASVCYYWYAERSRLDFFDFSKYRNTPSLTQANKSDSLNNHRVCFLGNSITANWINVRPSFFIYNNFINRGAGGQTSTQMLLRFQQDVVSLQPSILVLGTGINDIGEGDGFYDQNFTLQNIKSMLDICKANNIQVVLTSVLPVTEIKKNRFYKIDNPQQKIDLLNIEIRALANTNDLKYVDYNSKLQNEDGKFNELYTFDGIHPNEEGYQIMEKLVLEAISKIYN